MIACSSSDDLRGSKFLYEIPSKYQTKPFTSVLVQPLDTGCRNCIQTIESNMRILGKRYYVIMPTSPWNTKKLNCYQPSIHDYSEWNSNYIYPTEFSVDANGMIVNVKRYSSIDLANLINKLKEDQTTRQTDFRE